MMEDGTWSSSYLKVWKLTQIYIVLDPSMTNIQNDIQVKLKTWRELTVPF